MRRLKTAATQIGLGIGAVYGFFLIPNIEILFKPDFVLLLRQWLAIGFAVCLLINPKSLIEAGETFAPKLVSVLQIVFGSKKNKDE